MGAWAATDTGSGLGSTDALSVLMRGARAATDKGGSDSTDTFSILVASGTGNIRSERRLRFNRRSLHINEGTGHHRQDRLRFDWCLLRMNGMGHISPGRWISWGWGSLLLHIHIVGGGIKRVGGGSTGVITSFFCLLVLTDDMVWGRVRFWRFDFFCEAGHRLTKKSNPSWGLISHP